MSAPAQPLSLHDPPRICDNMIASSDQQRTPAPWRRLLSGALCANRRAAGAASRCSALASGRLQQLTRPIADSFPRRGPCARCDASAGDRCQHVTAAGDSAVPWRANGRYPAPVRASALRWCAILGGTDCPQQVVQTMGSAVAAPPMMRDGSGGVI
jgi:hypothetical protein